MNDLAGASRSRWKLLDTLREKFFGGTLRLRQRFDLRTFSTRVALSSDSMSGSHRQPQRTPQFFFTFHCFVLNKQMSVGDGASNRFLVSFEFHIDEMIFNFLPVKCQTLLVCTP